MDSYQSTVERFCGPHFSYDEIVKPNSRRFMFPPPNLQDNILTTLVLANELRQRLGNPLRVAAAYRPHGGAQNSQHKHNRALDLDVLDSSLGAKFYDTAIRLWDDFGRGFKMGLGLYCHPKAQAGFRVHIDSGYKFRTWQHYGGSPVHPPLATRQLEKESHGPQS